MVPNQDYTHKLLKLASSDDTVTQLVSFTAPGCLLPFGKVPSLKSTVHVDKPAPSLKREVYLTWQDPTGSIDGPRADPQMPLHLQSITPSAHAGTGTSSAPVVSGHGSGDPVSDMDGGSKSKRGGISHAYREPLPTSDKMSGDDTGNAMHF